jgi:hypothetical protein
MNPRHPGGLLASLRLCNSYWFLLPRAGRTPTATLGLGGDSRKQRIDFHIIQPLQCSGQVVRQEMALSRGQTVRSGFALWNSRKARPPSRSAEPKTGLVSSPRAAGLACLELCRWVAHRGNSWQGYAGDLFLASQPCQGRGRGFEPLRPLQIVSGSQLLRRRRHWRGAFACSLGEHSGEPLEQFPLTMQRIRRCGSSWRIHLAGRHQGGARCGSRGPRPSARRLFPFDRRELAGAAGTTRARVV